MQKRKAIITVTILLLSFSGCGYSLYIGRDDSGNKKQRSIEKVAISGESDDIEPRYYLADTFPNPVILTHAGMTRKKAYIENAYATLMDFHSVVVDIKKRGKPSMLKEIGHEVNTYIVNYVEPVLNDREAIENLESRAEIAKLYLTTAYLYYDLGGYYRAKYYLRQLNERVEDSFLWGITTNEMNSEFHTVAEGVAFLNKQISLKLTSGTT